MKQAITRGAWAVAIAAVAGSAGAGSLDRIFDDSFEAEAPGQIALCTPDNVQYPPANYIQAYSPTLEQLWLENTGEPIGGASTKVRFEGGTYVAMRFDRAMFPSGADVYTFNGDTSNVGVGLQGADFRFIAISECPGDLRVADNASPYPVLHQGCRVLFGTEGPFLYINWGPPLSNPNFCNLNPAKTYYFNAIFDDPYDGYDATRRCSTNTGTNHCGFRMAVQ